MMERNHNQAYGRNRVVSLSYEETVDDLTSESVSGTEHCGFPKKLLLNDNTDSDSSDDFVLHVITRMPDLTGYGPGTAPQSISIYRPKPSRWRINFEIVKKLSVRKWGALVALAFIVTVFAWSLFRGSDAQPVTQNTRSDIVEADKKPIDNAAQPEPLRSSTTQELNEFQFDGFGTGTPSSRASGEQTPFYTGSIVHSAQQNPYFGQQSIVQADTSSRDLPPWERQPNNTVANNTAVTPTGMPMSFGFPENSQWDNNIFPSSPPSDMMGTTGQPLSHNANQQVTYQTNVLSQNGQYQPVSQPLGYGGLSTDDTSSVVPQNVQNTQNMPGMIAGAGGTPSYGGFNEGFNNGQVSYLGTMPNTRQMNPQQFVSEQQRYDTVSRQIPAVSGYGASSQPVNYQQPPAGHENALAMNTTGVPYYSQYSQSQGQWPPQNTGTMPPSHGMQNPVDTTMVVPQQPPYSGSGSQNATQGNSPFAQQTAMLDVPTTPPGQSYPVPSATFHQYPNQYYGNQQQPQQQPFPNPNTNVTVLPSQNFYYR